MTADDEVAVVHRSRDLLVLSKPTGLPTTHPRGGDCLVARAATIDPDAPKLHASSRLDAEVTGLVTFARTRAGNAALLEARAKHHYRRLYVAIAQVAAPLSRAGAGVFEQGIAIDPDDPRRRIAVDRGAGRAQSARTRFAVAAHAGDFALLYLWPETGRTHQLRVHCAAADAPLLGDVHYGGVRAITLGNGRRVTARRTMLHCAALDVPDGAEKRARLALAPPRDVRDVWRKLGGDPDALTIGALAAARDAG